MADTPDAAIALQVLADVYACQGEQEAAEYADYALSLNDLPVEYAGRVRAIVAADLSSLDRANALDAIVAELAGPKRKRKPSVARMIQRARKYGVDVTVDGATY